MAKRSGNPRNRSGGRVTAKGTRPPSRRRVRRLAIADQAILRRRPDVLEGVLAALEAA